MPLRPNSVFLIHLLVTLLSILSFILSILAWTRTKTLSLPLPPALPILTTLLTPYTLATLTATTLLKCTASPKLTLIIPILNTLHTALTAILLTLVLAYLNNTTGVSTCTLDRTWQTYFHARDAATIRTIQDRLQCCGLRSVRDRAWPFKDRSHGDDACVLQLGYTRACAGVWRGEEVKVLWFLVVGLGVVGGLRIAFWVLRVRGMGGWVFKGDGEGGGEGIRRRREEYQRILDREVEEGGSVGNFEAEDTGEGDGGDGRDPAAAAAAGAGRLLPHSESVYEWGQR
ncbi:uncharacterized protein BO95DRAFT_458561 [Aspergillus brunneoviolaceus CBS 621.78]|uniref:Uncharacterized protein n=1 Tax=Aspergillus brunneoviolaceus CBS 621.78 TaxID=1450534 RepID=A0ACD1GPP0_9EURO|nr:hypothetical protein BO95DRAFT_458561 [Aspergillus brunneoviolaceus CBS 621.78]RAH51207.1 hypothetical protein BO95DRAFT_458561 [Aspergillus brunneoviolaceus CBS 621.78]